MKKGLLLRVLPVDVTKGKAAELVLLTEQGKDSLQIEVPHVIAKKVRDATPLEKIREKLNEFADQIEVKELPYARTDRKVLRVSGDREVLAEIHREHRLHFDEISVPQWLRWVTNYPYSYVTIKDSGRVSFEQMASLEDLLKLEDAALDIETNKKITKEEDLDDPNLPYSEINTAVYVREIDGKYFADVFTTLNTGLQRLDDNVRIYRFENWEQLVPALASCMWSSPAVFLHGHNIMSFDLLELRDRPDEEVFAPTADETEPKITAHAGFGKRVEIKDVSVFDHYGLARFYLPFLPDHRAETVDKFFGVNHEKTIKDYKTLGLKIWQAQNGSKEAASDVIKYAVGDAIASLKLGKKLKPIGLLLSKAFETSLESIGSVSPKVLGKNFWDKRTYENTNSFDFIIPSKHFQNFKVLEEKLKLLNLPEGARSGLIEGEKILAVYFNPSIEVFEIIKEYCGELWQAYQETNDVERFTLLRALDAIAEVPFYDLQRAGKEMPEYVFKAKYKINVFEANKRLRAALQKTNEFLQSVKILNYTDDLLLISGENLESKLPSTLMSIGKIESVYNQGTGIYVANLDGKLISQGIDLRGKGITTEKEKKLLRKFFETLLLEKDRSAALRLVYTELAKPLADGKIAKEDLLMKTKPGKDPKDYSINAQGRFFVWCAEKLGLEKGKEYYVGIGIGGKPYLKKDFLQLSVVPDYVKYREWIFEKGKFGTILKTVYNPNKEDQREKSLKRLFLGCAAQSDLELLASEVKVQKPTEQQILF